MVYQGIKKHAQIIHEPFTKDIELFVYNRQKNQSSSKEALNSDQGEEGKKQNL